MNPFQTILFLIFVLPAMMLKTLWKMLTGKMTKEEKNKWFWRGPYFLLFILIVLMIILWNAGYR